MSDTDVAPVERWTVTMRVISPCEHGVKHSILEVADGEVWFAVPECKDTKGNPRLHYVTPEKYPITVRRR